VEKEEEALFVKQPRRITQSKIIYVKMYSICWNE